MISHIPSLEKLVHELSRLPGVGPKTAQRLAYHILRSKDKLSENLRDSLKLVKENVRECPHCFSYTEEEDLCHYCTDPSRSDDVICVVEDPSDISRIDDSGAFRGRYHVLHGAISPLEGISPEDLKIRPLLGKLDDVKEVILALDADLEGDTTALYLAKVISERNVKVTRIAHGVPIGGHIDYIDHRTLGRALENRIQI